WQAEHVCSRLRAVDGTLDVAVEIIRTIGDRITDVPLARIGDRGLFTKEVDDAVLDGRCDVAVHSLKDVPTQLPEGLVLGAVLEREDPRDAFVPAPDSARTLDALPASARIGTSSLRRRALLLAARPDLNVDDLRGNLDTRLDRVAAGQYDAAVLAAAGPRRVGRADAATELLGPPHWLPAIGQGALAVVARLDDRDTLAVVSHLEHRETRTCVTAERSFLARLEGGCQIPIGALAGASGDALTLRGLVASLDGRTVVRGELTGPASAARELGERLAEQLLERGADAVLREIREAHDAPAPAEP